MKFPILKNVFYIPADLANPLSASSSKNSLPADDLSRLKNFLAQEFPKLDGGDLEKDRKQAPDPTYGPSLNLRPQYEGNWGRGTVSGGGGNPTGGLGISSNSSSSAVTLGPALTGDMMGLSHGNPLVSSGNVVNGQFMCINSPNIMDPSHLSTVVNSSVQVSLQNLPIVGPSIQSMPGLGGFPPPPSHHRTPQSNASAAASAAAMTMSSNVGRISIPPGPPNSQSMQMFNHRNTNIMTTGPGPHMPAPNLQFRPIIPPYMFTRAPGTGFTGGFPGVATSSLGQAYPNMGAMQPNMLRGIFPDNRYVSLGLELL